MTSILAQTHPQLSMGEAAAMGLLLGSQEINKIGYNPSIDGATQEDIWNPGGTYVPLTAEQGLDVVSDDNTNDKAAGTGALTVKITYLTSAFVSKSEVVTMNGTALVHTTATDIMYVNTFRVLTAGATGAAVGTITLKRLAGAGAAVQSQLAPGQTRGRKMYYTVPKGKMLMIDQLDIGSSGPTAAAKDFLKFTFRANFDENTGVATTLEFPFIEMSTTAGGRSIIFPTPLVFPEGVTTRVVVIGNATTATCPAYCMWRGHLMDM